MAALLKSVESKDFVGSNPTLSATLAGRRRALRACRHSRLIATARGSVFRLCERSATDPAIRATRRCPCCAAPGSSPPAALDARRTGPPPPRGHHEETGYERDEYPSGVDPEIRRLVRVGTTTTGNGPGSLRTEHGAARAADVSRLRRRAPAIQGSADRRSRTRTRPSVRQSAASPNEGGTAEGTTFRPGTKRSFLILEATSDDDLRPDQPGAGPATAANADTILLRATRPADLETPIGAFLRLDDGGPAYLLESVEGGERLGRYSFLGVGPRRLLEVRDGMARVQTRPVTEPVYSADLPIETLDGADPLAAIRAFVPRRRVQPTEGMPRFTGGAVGALAYDAVSAFEPTVPLPERDPVGVPTAAFIETDLVLVFDHLTHTLSAIASLHTEAPTSRPATGSPRRPSSRRSSGRRDRAQPRSPAAARDRAATAPGRPVDAIETSLGRDEYIHAVEVAKDAIAAGEAIQVVLARRQSFGLPTDPATGAPSTASGCTGRSAGSIRARTCSSPGRRPSRSSAHRPSCSSRSRATG